MPIIGATNQDDQWQRSEQLAEKKNSGIAVGCSLRLYGGLSTLSRDGAMARTIRMPSEGEAMRCEVVMVFLWRCVLN
jgi:hypothetical protein